MTQKITLSIPDMLHEKLTEWRSSFNFSKMFQDALIEAIQKKEELQKRFSDEFDTKEVIRRLRKEKEEWEQKFFKMGLGQGLKWARAARYEDLLYVLNLKDTYHIPAHERYRAYFEGVYSGLHLDRFVPEGVEDPERKFLDGWFKGVRTFWNEIKEQI